MKNILTMFFVVLLNSYSFGQKKIENERNRVVSKIDSTNSRELVLIQEIVVDSPIDSV